MVSETKMPTADFLLDCTGINLNRPRGDLPRGWSPTAPEEFQNIVPEADQVPLEDYFRNTPQQELPEAPHVLDLPKTGSTISLRFP